MFLRKEFPRNFSPGKFLRKIIPGIFPENIFPENFPDKNSRKFLSGIFSGKFFSGKFFPNFLGKKFTNFPGKIFTEKLFREKGFPPERNFSLKFSLKIFFPGKKCFPEKNPPDERVNFLSDVSFLVTEIERKRAKTPKFSPAAG